MQLPYLFEPLNLFLCQGVLFTDDFIPLSIISKEPTEEYVSLGSVSKNKLDLINSNFLKSVINTVNNLIFDPSVYVSYATKPVHLALAIIMHTRTTFGI